MELIGGHYDHGTNIQKDFSWNSIKNGKNIPYPPKNLFFADFENIYRKGKDKIWILGFPKFLSISQRISANFCFF